MSSVVDGAREVDAGTGDNIAQEGKHGHATMFDCHHHSDLFD
jgi:hypothetical protein